MLLRSHQLILLMAKAIQKAVARTSFDYLVIKGSVCHESINGMRADIHTQTYRKSGNFHVKIIHVLNIHFDLFSWVYGTQENILT